MRGMWMENGNRPRLGRAFRQHRVIEYIEALGGVRKMTGAGISEVRSSYGPGPCLTKDDFEMILAG